MEKYGSNSIQKPGQPSEKRVEAPVTTNVKVKKENSLARKFFAQDLKSTATGVTNDIVIPGFKNLVVNILKKAVDYLFLGTYTPNNNGYTPYNTFSSGTRNVTYAPGFNPNQGINGPMIPTARSTIYAINDVTFVDRGEAEEVLTRMVEIVQKYGSACVQDFYDLIQQKGSFTDNKYGWKDLSTACVIRGSDGYHIQFPKVIVLD